MAELQLPNILGQYNQGYGNGQSMLANKLAGQAFNAPADQRQSLLGQLAGVNPQAAMGMQSRFQQQDQAQQAKQVDHAKKINGAANYVLQAVQSKDPARIQGAYQAVRPYLAELTGKEPPPQWDDSMLPGLYQTISATGGTPQQKGTVVAPGGALVDSATGQQMFSNPATPANGQLVDIPDGQGGTVKMLFDPRTRQLSQPNFGGGQPAPAQGGFQAQITPASPANTGAAEQANALLAQGMQPQEVMQRLVQEHPDQQFQLAVDPATGQFKDVSNGSAQIPQGQGMPAMGQLGHAPPKSAGELDKRIALARSMGATDEQVKQMVLGQAATNGAPDVPGNAGATGDAYLQSLDGQTAAQVRALAEGRMAFPTGTALKSPYWQGMLGAVSQYDPNFDAVNYNARSNTRKAFTSGKEAQTVNALNTVAEHLGTLSDYADQLNNTSIPVINRIKNFAAAESGDPRIARFNTARKAAADEIAKVWRASGGSEADIQENLKNLDGAQSPEQLHAAIGTLVQLIGGKQAALQDQYSQGLGTTQSVKPLVSPEAAQAYQKVLRRAGMNSSMPTQAPASTPQAGGWSIQRVN